MATIAAAGIISSSSIAAGSFAAAAVMAVGSAIDSMYLMPMLMRESTSAGEFGSWDVNYAEEGSPGRYAYGQYNRLPGHIIYAGHPWNTTTRSGSSKRGKSTNHHWWTDVGQAIAFNKVLQTDRIDMEANPSYIRDITTTAELSWHLTPRQFETHFDEAQSVVVWQQVSAGVWNLVSWHMVIQNAFPNTNETLAKFIPGLTVEVESADQSGTKTANGIIPNRPVIHPGPLYQIKPNPWKFTVVSSRNHGTVTGVGPLGITVTIPRSRLVLDILGSVTTNGMLAATLIDSNGKASSTRFFQGVTTAVKNSFDPNGLHNPFNYRLTPSSGSWPRPLASDGLTIDYEEPKRQWAEDVLKADPPIVNVDYAEHTGEIGINMPNPIYEGRVGAENTPSLPGIAYWEMAHLNLSRWGSRIPQMHFYVDAREREYINQQWVVKDLTAARLLEILLEHHAGLPSSSVNVTSKVSTSQEIAGFNFGGLQEPAAPIGHLLLVADLHCVDAGGALTFKSRDNRDVVYLGWQHLDAREFNAPPGDMLKIDDQDLRSMPRRVNVKFLDVDKDLQAGEVYAGKDSVPGRWGTAPDRDHVSTRQITINHASLDAVTARGIANRVMADASEMRQRVRLRLPSWYAVITETDIIKVGGYQITPGSRGIDNPYSYPTKYLDKDFYVLVSQVDIGADFFVEIEGTILEDDPSTFVTASAIGPPGGMWGNRDSYGEQPEKLTYSAPAMVVAMDLPPLLDAHVGTTGVYFAYASPGSAHSQSGGRLMEDIGDGDNWLDIGPADRPAVMGRVVGKLGDGLIGVVGESPDLVVELLADDRAAGALETTTDVGLLNGDNLAAIGSPGYWEIIQFKTAEESHHVEFASDGRWVLTNLRRGLMGTERFVDSHEAGEWFVLLDRQNAHFQAFDNTLVGLSRRYKVQTSSGAVDSSMSTSITVQGNTSLSLAVANLVAWRKSNGDVVFTWNRRTRARYRTFGTQIAPLCEVTESYDIVIDLGTDRTINVSAETGTYTASMQSSDSKSGLEITATIYQRDSVRGRGQPHVMVVAQTQAEVGNNDGDVIGTENGHTLNTPLGGGMD
jgi:hypothetical protein